MDKVKEIFAGEITVADVADTGSFVIATTDANTQLVVKDVNVITKIDPSPKLLVDTFEVADLSADVTGSEIVDVSSSLIYQAYPTAPSLTSDVRNGIVDTTSTPSLIEITENLINGSVKNTSFSSPITITTAPNNYTTRQVDNIAFATNGDFFYFVNNGTNSQQLYKRAGGVNGTESTIFSASNVWCVFDGIETYYYNISSTLNKYNINTGVTTQVSFGVTLSGSNNPNARMINDGNILVYRGSTADTATGISIINPVTNQITTIAGLGSVSFSSFLYSMSAFYNSVTNRYTIYRRQQQSFVKSVLNGALTVGSSYSGGVTNTTFTLPQPFGSLANHHYNSYIVNDDVNYSVATHEKFGATDLQTFNTLTGATTTAPFIPFETYSDTFDTAVTINNVSPSLFTDTAKIRVTGVETTL